MNKAQERRRPPSKGHADGPGRLGSRAVPWTHNKQIYIIIHIYIYKIREDTKWNVDVV